jgi:nucleoside-diphosphate-sugar epimerase
VLDAARQAGGVEVVVYASTFEVYGRPRDANPVTETSPLAPFSDYGVTKMSGEDHSFAFAEEEGVPVIALRMPAIYGPGERIRRALPNFLRSVLEGERPTIYGDGRDRRDQLHVVDAAQSVERALLSRESGAYNVSDGEPHSIEELARTALLAAGLPGEPRFSPSQRPPFDFHMSIAKIRESLGFQPTLSLLEGMRQELRWLRAAGAGS